MIRMAVQLLGVFCRDKRDLNMTMQETKEAILSLLADSNGLGAQPYALPVSMSKQYMTPGNYVYAECIERGEEGGKLNWVDYSIFGEDQYVHFGELKEQIQQAFADNEWCQDVHATIQRNEDGMANRIDYRLHTFGIEHPENPDQPDFCPSCGWNTRHMKCNAGPDDHASESCHYLCANRGLDIGITTPCLREVAFNVQFTSDVNLAHSPNVVSTVAPDVVNAVGEIMVSYGLAENNLRAMMAKLPDHNPRSNLSADIGRLKKHKEEIVFAASVVSTDCGQAMEECIDAIVSAFGKVNAKRNALAHGQLAYVSSSAFSVGRDNTGRNREENSHLRINHNGEVIELTGEGIQEPLRSVGELRAGIRRLGEILEWLELLREREP